MICNSIYCEKRENCKNHICNHPSGTYDSVYDFSAFGSGSVSSISGIQIRALCNKEDGYPLFATIPNVTTESLLKWIEKGKVTETGDYSKGWNDSIDAILDHMRILGVNW